MNSSETTVSGATVVITHRVQEGKEGDYDRWLDEIVPLCKASVGHLDLQIVRPISGLTTTCTVIIRFDAEDHLRQWMQSVDRQRLIERAQPLFAVNEDYTIQSGLDFLFTPPGSGAKAPVRWKQFLITWSVIYPLVLGVPLVVLPVLHALGLPNNKFLSALFVTATIVFLVVYVIMPRYTKLVRRWLFDSK